MRIIALKPHERQEADFYLDVFLRAVKPPVEEELVKGAFGIALAYKLYEEGVVGNIRLVHDLSSEFLRITPKGPRIFSRSLRDRYLSGEVIALGSESDAYRLLALSILEDRRFPVILPEGPKLIEALEGDELREAIKKRLEMLLLSHGVDTIISKHRLLADEFGKKRISYEEAEHLVKLFLEELERGLVDSP